MTTPEHDQAERNRRHQEEVARAFQTLPKAWRGWGIGAAAHLHRSPEVIASANIGPDAEERP